MMMMMSVNVANRNSPSLTPNSHSLSSSHIYDFPKQGLTTPPKCRKKYALTSIQSAMGLGAVAPPSSMNGNNPKLAKNGENALRKASEHHDQNQKTTTDQNTTTDRNSANEDRNTNNGNNTSKDLEHDSKTDSQPELYVNSDLHLKESVNIELYVNSDLHLKENVNIDPNDKDDLSLLTEKNNEEEEKKRREEDEEKKRREEDKEKKRREEDEEKKRREEEKEKKRREEEKRMEEEKR
ncbi:hypothetical protein UPYG_G00049590, partial [Umbra pygmaea]